MKRNDEKSRGIGECGSREREQKEGSNSPIEVAIFAAECVEEVDEGLAECFVVWCLVILQSAHCIVEMHEDFRHAVKQICL